MDDLISRVKSICDELAGDDHFGGQAALAAAAGASKSVVNQWLANRIKSMDIRFALEIERNLGYNHIWLMIGKGNRKVDGAAQTGDAATRASTPMIADDAHRHSLPKTEVPVNADVLASIGFLAEDEARLLNWYRMSTDDAKELLMISAGAAGKKQLSALTDDETQNRSTRAGDRNGQ